MTITRLGTTDAQRAAPCTLTIDGRERHRRPRARRSGQAAKRRGHRHPGAVPRRALRPGRRLPHVRGRRRRARARGGLRPAVRGGHGGRDRRRRRSSAAARCSPSCCSADQPPRERRPEADHHRRQRAARARATATASTGDGRPACRRRRPRRPTISNPVIAVDHDACILCDRCVRACDDIQGNDVIGRTGKGYSTRIAFDLNDPMGESSLRHLRRVRRRLPHRRADQQADPRHPDPAAQRARRGRHASARTAASAAR